MRGFALVLVAGCGVSVTTTAINTPPHAMYARPAETVEMFASGSPARLHVDVTLMAAGAPVGSSAKLPDMVAALRLRAAAIGCDALVVMGAVGRGAVDGLLATCVAYSDLAPSLTRR